MKNRKLVSFVVILLIVSLSCNYLFPTTNKDGVYSGDLNQIEELPDYDPEAPLPSPGAAALRALALLEPGVAELESDVEAAERAAFNALLTDLQAQLSTGSDLNLPFLDSQGEAEILIPSTAASLPVSYNPLGRFEEINTADDVATVSLVVTSLGDQFNQSVPAGGSVDGSQTVTEGNTTTTMNVDLGRNADGSTKFGLGVKSDTSKDGVSTKTDTAGSMEGQRCPNAEGQVSFTIKVRLGAESGGSGYTQDLTAFVRLEVNDDAEITNTTIDITQGTRQVKEGRQVYVETGATYEYAGNDFKNPEISNVRLIRNSQDVTRDDISALSNSGQTAAYTMAMAAIGTAGANWLSGGCTKIEATSPGTVKPGSTTEIPVTVRHRWDGSEVPSKLEVALSGGQSVDPTSLPKTPGTLTYTAPGENGKSATITLTATSRRGRATLDLTANTGGAAYRIVGGLDDWQTDTSVCDIMKPFTLTGGGFTLNFSGGLSGTYSYSGGPFGAAGGDSYTISLPEGVGKQGTMTGGGEGCAGGECAGGTEQYTLTPLDPGAACTQ